MKRVKRGKKVKKLKRAKRVRGKRVSVGVGVEFGTGRVA